MFGSWLHEVNSRARTVQRSASPDCALTANVVANYVPCRVLSKECAKQSNATLKRFASLRQMCSGILCMLHLLRTFSQGRWGPGKGTDKHTTSRTGLRQSFFFAGLLPRRACQHAQRTEHVCKRPTHWPRPLVEER